MKFSICIPVYNGDKFIKKAIESVLSQTYTDWELIIYNNGSLDKTSEIINSYDDARLRIYEEGEIVSEAIPAWNKSMSYSTGDYVLMLGVDDWFHNNFLEESYQILVNNNFDLLTGHTDAYDLDFNFIEMITAASVINKLDKKNKENELISFLGKDFINAFVKDFKSGFSKFHLSTTLMKKEVFDKVGGFNEQLQYCGEAELYLKVAQEGGKFGYFTKVLVNYIGYGDERRAHWLSSKFKFHDFFKIPCIMFNENMVTKGQYKEMRLHIVKLACKQGFMLTYLGGLQYINQYLNGGNKIKWQLIYLIMASLRRVEQSIDFIIRKTLDK
jgi:glycosyltransferase involved in cell wall biosynthesis